MTTLADAPVTRHVVSWHRSNLDEWNRLAPLTQTRVKVGALVVATVIGFHYSLTSLLQTLDLDTPLAYVGLVPFLAGALAWVNRVPKRYEPPIHDRQLDYTIGIPLVAAAVLAEVLLPLRLGAMYWVNRLDLLFLPVFVTGAVILLFGVRVAWRQKVALAYLFLAWPWLYTSILLGTLGGFTSITIRALNEVLRIVPVAEPVPGGASQGLYQLVHGGHAFSVSVVTACSGVDGMVGFILIGAAFAAVITGSLGRKALWLAIGMVLLWTTNLLRLLLIFWVGRAWGEHVAIGILHPVAGLVMFCLGVGIMGLLLRPLGLGSGLRPPLTTPGPSSVAAPRFFAVLAMLLVSSLVLCASQARLRTFDPVAGASGQPKLGSFLAQPAEPSGWVATFDAEYTENKPFFGEDSRWFRYIYTSDGSSQTTLHSNLPVTADVIDTSDLESFDAYGVTACYSFHGFTLQNVDNVGLADGISGQALSFSGGTSAQNWSLVYWIWPVATGQGTRYERVVLYLQNATGSDASVGGTTASLDRADVSVETKLSDNRRFLVAFADQVIKGQARENDTAVLIDAVQAPDTTRAFWTTEEDHVAGGGEAGAGGSTAAQGGPAGESDDDATLTQDYARFWATYYAKHPPLVAASTKSSG